MKIFFNLTLIPPVKIPIFMFLLPRLIARASQPDGNMTSFTLHFSRLTTRHNSADSLPTSNLVCIKEVAIRTTLCIAGLIYYTCNLVTDIQCTPYKRAFNKRFLTNCVTK